MQTLRVALVSTYLVAVAAWLVITREIPAPSLGRIIRAKLRRPFAGELNDFRSEENYCWLASVPDWLLSDSESASSLKLYEDGKALGPAHSPHSDIRRQGRGSFSHWGATLYFSTSDNSDPRTNGRRYSVSE
jgi:hypothetical protein